MTEMSARAFDEAVPPSIEALLAEPPRPPRPRGSGVLERAAVIGKDSPGVWSATCRRPETMTTVDGRLAALEARRHYPGRRAPVGGRRVSFPPRPSPRRGICRDHKGATLMARGHAAWLERAKPDELVGYHAEQAHRIGAELPAQRPRGRALAPGRATDSHGGDSRLEERRHSGDDQSPGSRGSASTTTKARACEGPVRARDRPGLGDSDGAESRLNDAIDSAQDRRASSEPGSTGPLRLFSESVTNSDDVLDIAASDPDLRGVRRRPQPWTGLASRWIVRGGIQVSYRLAESSRARARPLPPVWLVSVRLPSGAGSCPCTGPRRSMRPLSAARSSSN